MWTQKAKRLSLNHKLLPKKVKLENKLLNKRKAGGKGNADRI